MAYETSWNLPLCDEAVSLDSVLIENEVPGYHTINVSGRESLEYDISDEARPIGFDGMEYYGKRQGGRTLTVRFALSAPTAAEFIARFRKLKAFCRGENREIRFADEPNAHYVGTLQAIEEPDPGILNIIGEMQFYCADPYLISDVITVVPAVEKDGKLVAHVNNDGSGEVYPTYRIKHTDENGYLGIVHASGTFEMGNIEEADGETYQGSEILFDTSGGDYSGWEPYTGQHPQNSRIDCNGTLKVAVNHPAYESYNAFWLDNPGTEISGRDAYGGCRRIVLPADSNGDVGAQNFYLWFQQQFITGAMGQTGHNQITLADEDNKLICAFATSKVDMAGNTAYARFYIGDGNGGSQVYKTFFFEPGDWDSNIYHSRGYEDMRKLGGKIQWFYGGSYFEIEVPALAAKKVKYVYVFIGQHNTGRSRVTVMNVGKISGTKLNVDKWSNLPNRYPAGSEVVVNCETDDILVNGLPRNDEMIDGSAFYVLPAGETDIEFHTSSWCKKSPEVTIEFRKRWL